MLKHEDIDFVDENSLDLTEEQISAIWKRVLNRLEDTAGPFDALMIDTESYDPGLRDIVNGHGHRYDNVVESDYDEQGNYSVYSDIENSIYQSPTEVHPQNNVPFVPTEPNDYETPKPDITKTIPVPIPEDFGEHARKLIDEELAQSKYCRALSRAASIRRASRILSLISNRDYSSARNIASAYFMESSNYYFPRSDRVAEDVPYYRTALRDAWKNEVALTSRCTNAAEMIDDDKLIKTLVAAARGHAQNAVDLRRLIEQSLD